MDKNILTLLPPPPHKNLTLINIKYGGETYGKF